MEQYWQLFGLPENATAEELRSRYRQLVKKWHPDKYAQDPKRQAAAEAYLKLINQAYRVLTRSRAHWCTSSAGWTAATDQPHRSAAEYTGSVAELAPTSWLQAEWTLTYLPLLLSVLIVARKFQFALPAACGVAAILIMAWSMMAYSVWTNTKLSVPLRAFWIIGMIVLACVMVPIYFTRHTHVVATA